MYDGQNTIGTRTLAAQGQVVVVVILLGVALCIELKPSVSLDKELRSRATKL